MSWTPLRPALYEQLRRRFSKGGVQVAHRGRHIQWSLSEPKEIAGKSRVVRVLRKERGDHWGEIYKVDCPYCNDVYHRLYISHMWGLYDEVTESKNLWLCYCQNENCVRGYEQQEALYAMVHDESAGGWEDKVKPGSVVHHAYNGGVVEWPGTVWPLDRMPQDMPVCNYWRDVRGFDPIWLARHWGVGHIIDTKVSYGHVLNHTFIPVYQGGKLVGWQARWPDYELALPDDKPKYISATNMPRASLLYNFEAALRSPWVAVVEGPPDVWRFGPEAVATFGKGVSSSQAAMLTRHWERILIMLDPDATKESYELVAAIKRTRPNSVVVELPEGIDPSDLPTSTVRRIAFHQAALAGVVI
jgi:hypothetical protein